MSVRRIVLLAAVVAALALYYNIKEVRIAREKKAAEELKAKLFPHPKEDVAEFRLVRKEGTVRARKGEKGWSLLEPLEEYGDQFTLDNMAANLTNSITLRTLIEKAGEKDLPEYGLDNPYMEVYVKLKDGREEGPVLIGDISPMGGYVYAKRPADKNIYLANVLFRKGLDKSLYQMRDKTLLHANEGDLKEIELTAPGVQVRVEKGEKGEWRITHPRELAVDEAAMRELFNALRDSKIKKFVEEEPATLEPYGLEEPEYRYTFSPLQDGPASRGTATLLVGDPVEGEDMVYAKYQDAPKVFALGRDLLEKMPKSLFDFRRKRVFTFSSSDIQKIEIEQQGIKLVCEREKEEDEWRITSPRKLKGDYYQINTYLSTVSGVKASSFFHYRQESAPEYGFQAPYLAVRLWPGSARQPVALVVGEKAGRGLGRYARADSTEELIIISDATVKKLTVNLNDLRDKYLTSFEEKEVKKMVMELPGSPPLILKREDGEKWRLVEPVKTRVESLRVKSTLWRLEALRFNDVISEEAGEDAHYGFDEPSARITLWGRDESKPLDVVTLGNSALKKDNIYVRVKSKAGVFTTDADLLEKLPGTVEELKRKM